jgi:hypothetical protein
MCESVEYNPKADITFIILPLTPMCFSWPLSRYLTNKILFTVFVSPMLTVNMPRSDLSVLILKAVILDLSLMFITKVS